MIDVHKRLHSIALDTKVKAKGDAIVPVARELAQDGRILCFDEFQVTDIADGQSFPPFFPDPLADCLLFSHDPAQTARITHRLWLRHHHYVKVRSPRCISLCILTVYAAARQTTSTKTAFNVHPFYPVFPSSTLISPFAI